MDHGAESNNGLSPGTLFDGPDPDRNHLELSTTGNATQGRLEVSLTEAGSGTQSANEPGLERPGWHHVGLNWSTADGRVDVFLDQLQDDRDYPSGWEPTDQVVTFGPGITADIDEIFISAAERTDAWMRFRHLDARGFTLNFNPVDPTPEAPWAGTDLNPDVLWAFNEAMGDVVEDVSSGGNYDLTIEDPDRVTWLPGGLRFDSWTTITADVDPSAFIDECTQTEALSIEMWLHPDHAGQVGPTRVVTLSSGASSRAFTLGMGLGPVTPASGYSLRLRTTETDGNGRLLDNSHPLTLASAEVRRTHVVAVWESEEVSLYVDGALDHAEAWTGALSDMDGNVWSSDNRFALGNEIGGDRGFVGTLYSVALYCRALNAGEVFTSYSDGPR